MSPILKNIRGDRLETSPLEQIKINIVINTIKHRSSLEEGVCSVVERASLGSTHVSCDLKTSRNLLGLLGWGLMLKGPPHRKIPYEQVHKRVKQHAILRKFQIIWCIKSIKREW